MSFVAAPAIHTYLSPETPPKRIDRLITYKPASVTVKTPAEYETPDGVPTALYAVIRLLPAPIEPCVDPPKEYSPPLRGTSPVPPPTAASTAVVRASRSVMLVINLLYSDASATLPATAGVILTIAMSSVPNQALVPASVLRRIPNALTSRTKKFNCQDICQSLVQ